MSLAASSVNRINQQIRSRQIGEFERLRASHRLCPQSASIYQMGSYNKGAAWFLALNLVTWPVRNSRRGCVLRGLDIFCGMGGSSTGAQAAGVRIVCAIDMCPVATATYKANFPTTSVVRSPLERINLSKLRRKIGRIDILLASPECTNHTCAKGAAPRSERSRATAMQVVRFARAFQPRWIVLENVVHMRPWSRYEELKRKLQRLGYHLAEQILDSSDFGVAQRRRRLFLVGDRKREPTLARTRRGRKRAAGSVLDRADLWTMRPLFGERRASGTIARARRAFRALGKGKSFLLVYYGTDGAGGWQSLTRPLRTVTTIDRFALVEFQRRKPMIRMLQVPELRRAMGFGDDYKLELGTRREKIRLLGNAVCPPVMNAVIIALVADCK